MKIMTLAVPFITVAAFLAAPCVVAVAQTAPATQLAQDASKDAVKVSGTDTTSPALERIGKWSGTWELSSLGMRDSIFVTVVSVDADGNVVGTVLIKGPALHHGQDLAMVKGRFTAEGLTFAIKEGGGPVYSLRFVDEATLSGPVSGGTSPYPATVTLSRAGG